MLTKFKSKVNKLTQEIEIFIKVRTIILYMFRENFWMLTAEKPISTNESKNCSTNLKRVTIY